MKTLRSVTILAMVAFSISVPAVAQTPEPPPAVPNLPGFSFNLPTMPEAQLRQMGLADVELELSSCLARLRPAYLAAFQERNIETAQTHLKTTREWLTTNEDKSCRAFLLLLDSLLQGEEVEAALARMGEAAALLETIGDRAGGCFVQFFRSVLLRGKGLLSEARVATEDAISQLEKLEKLDGALSFDFFRLLMPEDQAGVLAMMDQMSVMGMMPMVQPMFAQMLQAGMRLQVGIMERTGGHYDQALEQFKLALDSSRRVSLGGATASFEAPGGMLDGILTEAEQARLATSSPGLLDGAILIEMARTYVAMGNQAKAKLAFEEALTAVRSLGDTALEAEIRDELRGLQGAA